MKPSSPEAAPGAAPQPDLTPSTKPTLHFVGMTTARSSIMRVFPRWAEALGLGDVAIHGIDCRWHDDPQVYRQVVTFIRDDPLSRGALVTTHKIDLLHASRDLFAYLDPFAELMGEISCIAKRGSSVHGFAKDPISSGLALEAFLPPQHWKETGAEAFVLGAGGSAIAITTYLMAERHGANRPSRIIVSNRSPARLEEMARIHRRLPSLVPIEYRHTPDPAENDAIMAGLRPRSVVMNATGLGKDAPGSPLTDAARFPERGWVWDFNYRGDLVFLAQARAQAAARHLTIEDGWVYFLHGWTQVIAEVFQIEIPPCGIRFDALSRIARGVR